VAEYLSQYIPYWIAYALIGLIQAGLLLALMLVTVAVFTWVERKVSARIQDRLGPTRRGGRFGWLQPPADGIKLLLKEDLVPKNADAFFFRIAPYICFCTTLCVFMAIPFADGWVAERLNTGIFFVLAIAGLGVFGVVMAGYSSGSKWSLFGAMREATQVISYEVPMAMALVVPVMVAGTMDLVTIGNMQAGWFTNWFIFHDPFTFIVFWVYFTCAVASTNRAPFDLPEAESELVAGFMTEYSGFRWAIFFMAEYGSMLVVSCLAVILFFGAWNGPIPVTQFLGLTNDLHPIAGFAANLLGLANCLIKACICMTVIVWVRWSLPRLRIDQVMATCWKYCVPLAAAMLLGAMLWSYAFPAGLLFRNQAFGYASEKSDVMSDIKNGKVARAEKGGRQTWK